MPWVSVSQALNTGVLMIRITASLIFAAMAGGRWAGPKRPYHVLLSNPGRPQPSATVGTSGKALSRVEVVTASAITWPPLTAAIDGAL